MIDALRQIIAEELAEGSDEAPRSSPRRSPATITKHTEPAWGWRGHRS